MAALLRKTRLKIKKIAPPPLSHITSHFFSGEFRQHSLVGTEDGPPTSASYDEQVAVAGRSKNFEMLHHLLNKRAKDGCFNTKNTFNFITEDSNHPNSNIIDDLVQTLARLDRGFTRKNAFDSLISHLCKTNRIDDALRVITAIIRDGHGVNATTFHPVLNALTRKRRIDEAWRIIELMKETGTHVDVTAYNYVLTAHCADGDLIEASEVLKKILEEGLKEDARTYDAMVLGACRVGRVEGAMVILRRMEEEKLPALYCTHAHVIKGLIALGCFGLAMEFVRGVGGRDKELDAQNFGLLGSWLVRKRRVSDAKLAFDEMAERGLHVGEKLRRDYMSLLDGNNRSDMRVVGQ